MIETYYDPSFNNGHNILVFGSNEGGYHGGGAAKDALLNWGAKMYQGEGIQGYSYGVPTKDRKILTLDLSTIKYYVDRFKIYAAANREKKFLVTRIGCGLAGYKDKDIAPLFRGSPGNCILPESFKL